MRTVYDVTFLKRSFHPIMINNWQSIVSYRCADVALVGTDGIQV